MRSPPGPFYSSLRCMMGIQSHLVLHSDGLSLASFGSNMTPQKFTQVWVFIWCRHYTQMQKAYLDKKSAYLVLSQPTSLLGFSKNESSISEAFAWHKLIPQSTNLFGCITFSVRSQEDLELRNIGKLVKETREAKLDCLTPEIISFSIDFALFIFMLLFARACVSSPIWSEKHLEADGPCILWHKDIFYHLLRVWHWEISCTKLSQWGWL